MVFLDANPIIYYVEQPAVWGPKASARLAGLRAAGDDFAVAERAARMRATSVLSR